MPKIADNLTHVLRRIQLCAQKAGRNPASITLLAVSKTKSAAQIQLAYDAGQRDFGENYLQEAIEKIDHLHRLDISWHFIGPLQSNKTRIVAEHFDWLHTLDRRKIAERLNQQRPPDTPPLQVCIQVNIDRQDSKSGCMAEDATSLAQFVASLPNLQLRGLMAIPSPDNSEDAFRQLRQLRDDIGQQTGLTLDTLSMGMSDDLDCAIAAGSTIVRIGTAIFGRRETQ